MKTLISIIIIIGISGCGKSEKNIENVPIYGETVHISVGQKMEYFVDSECGNPVWMTTKPDIVAMNVLGNSVMITALKVGEGQLQVECIGGGFGVIHPTVFNYRR